MGITFVGGNHERDDQIIHSQFDVPGSDGDWEAFASDGSCARNLGGGGGGNVG